MQLLLNKQVQEITKVDTQNLALETAKLYQSIFAMEPWNEAGIDINGNSIAIVDLENYFKPFHSIQSVSQRIHNVIQNPGNIFLISASHESFLINSELLGSVIPLAGEFSPVLKSVEINNQPLYVNGFLWATRMPTLDVLIDRGDFETSQASSIVRSCELDTECIFINELAIAREFQHSQIGRMLKEMLEKHLDKKRLPVFANTIVNSGAYKLFEQMGAMVLSGPGIHNRDGYVLSLKKY